jgi:hypothetical protein
MAKEGAGTEKGACMRPSIVCKVRERGQKFGRMLVTKAITRRLSIAAV